MGSRLFEYPELKMLTDAVASSKIISARKSEELVQKLCRLTSTHQAEQLRQLASLSSRVKPDNEQVYYLIDAIQTAILEKQMCIRDRPNLVGVDIGCGMETTRIREGRLELQKLDKLIYEKIPSGFSIRDKAHRYLNEIDLSELCCARHVDLLRAEKSIGTLGGGNHFIEVDKDDEGNLYIVVHSGSRHLGVEVASYCLLYTSQSLLSCRC